MIPATTAPEPLLVTRPPSPSFYKRKLPQSCTAYASPQGKQLFKTALLEGNLEGYFPLSSQYITQNEPAYCGLGTLCMILNALDVDPRRKWKGPWRWYEQEMLDCCRPLTAVASVGITLNEFACLARCNGLSATVVSPSPSSPEEQETKAIEKFRSDVKHAAKGLGTVIALSYSRKTLGQTGDGHFSPIGGYCEEQDMVLVLDVARFKYPAYWIPLKLAWESMKPIDKATGQPRSGILVPFLSFLWMSRSLTFRPPFFYFTKSRNGRVGVTPCSKYFPSLIPVPSPHPSPLQA
ncbi:Phytochelatin-domain-containing protein [Meredithblackwellia eburnea MCA 4105]